MANNCPVLAASSTGVEEEDEEIELSLGLSIGGNCRNSTKSNPQERKLPIFSSDKINSEHANVDADLGLESQRLQSRVRERERRENEANAADRIRKRDNNTVNAEIKVSNSILNHNGSPNLSPNPIRAGPMCYPYPQLQYPPLRNGFAYPCVMPHWASNSGSVGDEKEEKNFQQSFRQYQGHQNPNPGQNPVVGSDSERDSREDGGDGRAVWNGSPAGNPSGVSDYGISSGQGGSSSDSGSHSSLYRPEQSQLNEASEQLTQSSSTKFSEQTRSEIQPETIRNPISPLNQSPYPSKAASSEDLAKSPNPQAQNHNTTSFSQMLRVSTTGNGPNGKTIHGFLYRYTPMEVSIVCVCHGTSFSPAEFVEHAGGKNVSHPLRHITVVPSAF